MRLEVGVEFKGNFGVKQSPRNTVFSLTSRSDVTLSQGGRLIELDVFLYFLRDIIGRDGNAAPKRDAKCGRAGKHTSSV